MTFSDTKQLADLKRALDHAAIVAITDVSGRITYVNDTFCEISGYCEEALIGQDADDGPGIPAPIRVRVLDPFFTTKARGGGLGLPIAKRTAELHGGAFELSCPESGGTVVTLTLPIRPRNQSGTAGELASGRR